MYKIVNDICSICSKQFWSEADDKVKKSHPKWLTKNGHIKSNNFHSFSAKKKQEYTNLNPGPVTCCQVTDFSATSEDWDEYESGFLEEWASGQVNICLKHLKEIVTEAEKFDNKGAE